ncbi:MAG: hypothetical protein II974_11395 [Firmicutes bacterium]|nr:hypothetical protein [Bacillota bacterium]MBR0522789.1 hypothetical protein [Bacillota bacterium]
MDIRAKNYRDLSPDEIKVIVMNDGSAFRPARRGEGADLICVTGSAMPPKDRLLALMKKAEALNSPGGEHFEATKRLLENYRAAAFCQNRPDPFDLGAQAPQGGQFQGAPASRSIPLKSALPQGSQHKSSQPQSTPQQRFKPQGSQFQSSQAQITPPQSSRPQSSPNQNAPAARPARGPQLPERTDSSILTGAVQQGIEAMLSSPSETILDAGELLYARYIKPEYAAKTPEFYMTLFRSSRATWFRMVNRAVSLLSAYIFGVLPEDCGV